MMPHKDILINMWIEKANTAIEDAQEACGRQRLIEFIEEVKEYVLLK